MVKIFFLKKIFLILLVSISSVISSFSQVSTNQKFKKIIFGCRTNNSTDFEEFVKRAKKSGATHINLTNEDIPLAKWQYDTENDPYPAWVITNIGLLKVATPNALKQYLPQDYAEKVFKILEERCKILRKYNIKASLTTFEPQMLPEKVYEDHPLWRGPRVDHPARSIVARWAPDIDNNEVLQLYKEAITILLKRCPEIDIIQFNTNDSGTGLSWSPGLYSGGSGNTFNKARSMDDRLFSFFSILQEAATLTGNTLDINVRWTRESFPERIAKRLSKGMAVESLEGPNATPFASEVGSVLDYYQFFYPVVGIPEPVKFLEELEKGFGKNTDRLFVFIGDRYNRELYFDLFDQFKSEPTSDIVSRLLFLQNFAKLNCRTGESKYLFNLWYAIGEAQRLSYLLQAGGYIYYLGSVQQRWLTRPFVPFPEELKNGEKSYFRKYQFQARTEAEADDLSNLQATLYYKGWTGMYFITNVMDRMRKHIAQGRTDIHSLLQSGIEKEQKEYFKQLDVRLQALSILSNNVQNAISYQAQLDRAKTLMLKPELLPEHGAGSTWDRNFMLETARQEIDNSALLISLLESSNGTILDLAPVEEQEDIRRFGPDIIEQLKLKLKIMNAHWLDYNRIFTTPNL